MEQSELQKCKSSASGVHEYVTSVVSGEECKHCGLLRSTIEQSETMIPSPFGMDAFGNLVEKGKMPVVAMPSEEQIIDIVRRMEEKHLSDETFNRILEETKSKSAIVITFDKPLTEQRFTLTDFHIAVANVAYPNVRAILGVILEALKGRLGGSMHLRKNKGDDNSPTTA